MNQRAFSYKAITIFVILCIFSSNAYAAWPAPNGTACFSSAREIKALEEYQFMVKKGEESLQEFIQFALHRIPGTEPGGKKISNIEFSSLNERNNEAKKEAVANRLKQIDAFFLDPQKEGHSYKSYTIENKKLLLDLLTSQKNNIKKLQQAFNEVSLSTPLDLAFSLLILISDVPEPVKFIAGITASIAFAKNYLKVHRRLSALKYRDKHIVDFNQQMIDFVDSAGPGEYMIISRDIQVLKRDFNDLLDALGKNNSSEEIKNTLKESLNLQYVMPLLNPLTKQLWGKEIFKVPDTELSIDIVLEKLQDGYPVLRLLYREKDLLHDPT